MYNFDKQSETFSPSLIFYLDYIKENIEKCIEIAGSANRLWPHIKTHKCSSLVKLQMEYGINRFKVATIAEAEMVASCGALHVVIAYPVIGPNINRYKTLCEKYENTVFYAVGDDLKQIGLLAKKFSENQKLNVLIDVNLGQDRTGVHVSRLESFHNDCLSIDNVRLCGLHCYDGHRHEGDFKIRDKEVKKIDEKLFEILNNLPKQDVIIMGGTPSFPCHAKHMPNAYLSPGTLVLHDYGYATSYRDMDFKIAAAVLCRVISRPTKNTFTIDLGTKAVACDPKETRAVIFGMEHAKIVMHNEEHMVFSVDVDKMPEIGDELFLLPFHICPTVSLYNVANVIESGKLTNVYKIDARNRVLNI